MKPRRARTDAGQMAGIETIPLGILVFISGTLIVVNAWGILNANSTADSIAREYLRAYTSAHNRQEALAAGDSIATSAIDARGLDRARVSIDAPTNFAPSATAQVTVRITIPDIRAPFLGELGHHDVVVTHRDRVDAFRSNVSGQSACF